MTLPFVASSNHTTTIRADKHGLFFRTEGVLFRPQPSRNNPRHRLGTGETSYQLNSKVRVKHVAHTSYGAIQGYRGRVEFWYAHGTSNDKANTEELWNPA